MDAQGWQPIETAPKDGSDVFLWGYLEDSPFSRPHIGSDERYEAYWESDGWRSVHFEGWIVEPMFWFPTPPSPHKET
jgi:hypothetical protein